MQTEPAPVRLICTRRRDHAPFDSETDAGPGTYRASVWDHEEEGWEVRWTGVRLMGLRAVIRIMESDGWSPVSYLIEKE